MGEVIEVDFSGDNEPEKKKEKPFDTTRHKVFRELAENHDLVHVVFDTRKPGIVAPASVLRKKYARLNFGYWNKAPDFAYDEKSVRSSLLFSGHKVWCEIPWEAVIGMKPIDKG